MSLSWIGPARYRFITLVVEETPGYLPPPPDYRAGAPRRPLAHGTVRRISRHSGLPIEWRINTVWTFDGDKLVRGRAFSSRAEALEAAELRD